MREMSIVTGNVGLGIKLTRNSDRIEQLVVAVWHGPQMKTDLLRDEFSREVEEIDVAPRLRVVNLKKREK